MNLLIKTTRPILVLLVLMLAGAAASAQDAARLQFDRLNRLETKARDVVEVNIDGKLLELAKRVTMKVKDDDAKKVAAAINGLRGIYVRVYNFDKENEYEPNDIDEIRAQLNAPGWEKLANVRSKRNNQKVDVFTMFSGDKMDGLAVVLSEAKTVAVVNVIGMVDIETLVELSGKMNIPKIDILRDDKPKNEKED
jgi:translation initiation factor IF-1